MRRRISFGQRDGPGMGVKSMWPTLTCLGRFATVVIMKRWTICLILVFLGVWLWPCRCPAPLVYRPGEGWSYEALGGAQWERELAEDQLKVAQEAYERQDYRLALKAARRVVKHWPYSDVAPEGQLLVGRCYEARKQDEKAFKAYNVLLEKYPKSANYSEILNRQYEIANHYLNGRWFRLWGYIPYGPSMDRTAEMYEKIVKAAPQSTIAPSAQLKIGVARERQKDYVKAAEAFEIAADRYHHIEDIAAEAQFNTGVAYQMQAKKAEYDQSMAGKAIAAFADFNALYPNDPRNTEARQNIESLRTEQARGSYKIGKFYERRKRWSGALVYYNEVLVKDPNSSYAEEAKLKIESIKRRTAPGGAN